jgi:hypothetical protein
MHKKFPYVHALLLIAFLLTTAAVPLENNPSGFQTEQPSMLTPVMTGVEVTPLLTVGDVLPSGFA